MADLNTEKIWQRRNKMSLEHMVIAQCRKSITKGGLGSNEKNEEPTL